MLITQRVLSMLYIRHRMKVRYYDTYLHLTLYTYNNNLKLEDM